MFNQITSLQNPQIKDAARLRERRDRDQEGVFLIEGWRELRLAVENRYPVETVYFSPNLLNGDKDMKLLNEISDTGARVFEVNEEILRKITYRKRPEGVVAVARQVRRSLDEIELNDPPLLLVAEGIEKPGNLGSMLRAADGAGADGLILCDSYTDMFNPNVVRASTGTLFTVPVVETASEKLVEWLHGKNVNIIASTPGAERNYTEPDFTRPSTVVVGAEQNGLSEMWLQKANWLVHIPMLGRADSLNVAASAALMLYEAVRQRKKQ